MRESLAYMLETVDKGLSKHRIDDKLVDKAKLGANILKGWDYRYDRDKP